MIAYEITNLVTGKRYIGITRYSATLRWAQHQRAARRGDGPKIALLNAIRKYGASVFRIRELASARNWPDLQYVEIALIAQEDTMVPFGYNRTIGGEGVVGTQRDAGYRANISASISKVWAMRDKDTRAAIVAKAVANRTWVSTPEHGRSLSAALRGKKKSAEHRAAIALSKLGNTSRTGQTNSTAHRARISAAKMGHEVDQETRAKIAATLRARARLLDPNQISMAFDVPPQERIAA